MLNMDEIVTSPIFVGYITPLNASLEALANGRELKAEESERKRGFEKNGAAGPTRLGVTHIYKKKVAALLFINYHR